jgi:hypothetical protein
MCDQDRPLMKGGLCGKCMHQLKIDKRTGMSTMSFFDRFNQDANRVQNLPAVQDPNQIGMTDMPVGIQQMGNAIKGFMPMMEEITGLNRKEITLTLLKNGLKGNNLVDLITGLADPKPTPQAKIITMFKTAVIYVPLFVALMGGTVIFLIFLAKLLLRSI